MWNICFLRLRKTRKACGRLESAVPKKSIRTTARAFSRSTYHRICQGAPQQGPSQKNKYNMTINGLNQDKPHLYIKGPP